MRVIVPSLGSEVMRRKRLVGGRGSGGAAQERRLQTQAFLHAPFCPAGHLPHEGGDWLLRRRRHSCNVGDWRKRA
ncbi:MAG: hypothetical protein EOS77_30875 [Mesorhizobium sp.]|nr:MAG: hypothetical protein EOS77_30875 [Mesorhizobium sp.]